MYARRNIVVALAAALLLSACAPLVVPEGRSIGRPPEIRQSHCLHAFDGAALQLERFEPADGPPRAIIVALHSFNDYSGFCRRAAQYFTLRGIAVFAFDQRGFGATTSKGYWPGTQTLTDDLRAAIDAVHRLHENTPIFLFGESMGAAVIMATMAETPDLHVAGVILAAPAVREDSLQNRIVNAGVWVAAHIAPWYEVEDGAVSSVGVNDPAVTEEMNADPILSHSTRVDAAYGMLDLMLAAMAAAPQLDQRMMLMHGARDALISNGAMHQLLDRLPPAASHRRTFAYYSDGYHKLLRDGRQEIIWRDIASWIDNPEAPLPSTADLYALQVGTCLNSRLCPIAPEMTAELE